MKSHRFFLRLLTPICEKFGVGMTKIGLAQDDSRSNGHARLTTWIDAYDELLNFRDETKDDIARLTRDLEEMEKGIAVVENEMKRKGVSRCPDCLSKDEHEHWGMLSAKGTGNMMYRSGPNAWTDCPTCEGTGVVTRKKVISSAVRSSSSQ